jgi:hypothetical protein
MASTPLVRNLDIYSNSYLLRSEILSVLSEELATLVRENAIDSCFAKSWMLENLDLKAVISLLSLRTIELDHDVYVLGNFFIAKMGMNYIENYRELTVTISCNYKRLEEIKSIFESHLREHIVDRASVSKMDADWYFKTKDGVDSRRISEICTDVVHEESYPYIENLPSFVDGYLNSSSSVLVLIGPQGTGKTRLIRHIIKQKGEQKKSGHDPLILYTTDFDTIADEGLYISFRCEPYDFMVLEDIDNQLVSRNQGNQLMHKFLASSDGLIAARRKIILSTNLNINDIDKALVRRGRCYAAVEMRNLDRVEAMKLYCKLTKEKSAKKSQFPKEHYSLADIYSMAEKNSSNIYTGAKKVVGFGNKARVESI